MIVGYSFFIIFDLNFIAVKIIIDVFISAAEAVSIICSHVGQ